MIAILLGKIPRKIIFGIMEHESHLGDLKKNPFNFGNHSINHVQVFVNSEPYPQRPYKPDFDSGLYNREYFALFDNLDQAHLGYGTLDIDHAEFKKNNCFFAFDFSPDRDSGCGTGSHISLPKSGSLRIEVHFKTAPVNPLKLVIFAEFDSTIEINKNREVICDF